MTWDFLQKATWNVSDLILSHLSIAKTFPIVAMIIWYIKNLLWWLISSHEFVKIKPSGKQQKSHLWSMTESTEISLKSWIIQVREKSLCLGGNQQTNRSHFFAWALRLSPKGILKCKSFFKINQKQKMEEQNRPDPPKVIYQQKTTFGMNKKCLRLKMRRLLTGFWWIFWNR